MKVKKKFRKLFIDFLDEFEDSSLSKERYLQLFDKLWDTRYSENAKVFLDFCNTIVHYDKLIENKTTHYAIRARFFIMLCTKMGLIDETRRDEILGSIDSMGWRLFDNLCKASILFGAVYSKFNSTKDETAREIAKEILSILDKNKL